MHFFPMTGDSSSEGLLVINHEATSNEYLYGADCTLPGWIVEIGPFDASSTPKKRTAFGRFKHDNAALTLSADKRVVVYMGNNQMLAADPVSEEIRRFLVGPAGCEITGISWTPDRSTMFINVQHPGETGGHPDRPDPGGVVGS